MMDGLSKLYRDLLSGSYDCVDRIVLNAYFGMAHSPGGFRIWWRALTGSDETLDNAHLMRLAGRFGRRVRGYAKAHGIPVVDCVAGERKHDVADGYLAKTTVTEACFWCWSAGPRHRCGTSERIITSRRRSLTRFTFSTATGGMSPSRSAGILRSPPR